MSETERIPNSERLQRKMLAKKYPGNRVFDQWFLVWFPDELRYSSVEGKNTEGNLVLKEHVTVKRGKDVKWAVRIVFIGSKEACQRQQLVLDKILEGNVSEIEKPLSDSESCNEELNCKKGRRKKKQLFSDDEDSDIDDHAAKTLKQVDVCEAALNQEKERVEVLLKNVAAKNPLETKLMVTTSTGISERGSVPYNAYFEEVNRKLDEMKELLQSLVESNRKPTSTSTITPPAKKVKHSSVYEYSPGEMLDNQSRNGSPVNPNAADTDQFLVDDEYEMREGSVEPREGAKKAKLDQGKIYLLRNA